MTGENRSSRLGRELSVELSFAAPGRYALESQVTVHAASDPDPSDNAATYAITVSAAATPTPSATPVPRSSQTVSPSPAPVAGIPLTMRGLGGRNSRDTAPAKVWTGRLRAASPPVRAQIVQRRVARARLQPSAACPPPSATGHGCEPAGPRSPARSICRRAPSSTRSCRRGPIRGADQRARLQHCRPELGVRCRCRVAQSHLDR